MKRTLLVLAVLALASACVLSCKKKTDEPAVKEEPASKQPTFCIVAASHVSKKGADELVARLQEEGYTSTRVYLYNNIRRVIIGSYPTEAEANSDLQKMHANKELAEAWVYEMKK